MIDIASIIRDIPDFPKEGIIFKDITPLLGDPEAMRQTADRLAAPFLERDIDAVCGVEARGWIFGALLAERLAAAFVPIRKPGKLPYKKIARTYDLEYGTNTIEIHTDAIQPGQKVQVQVLKIDPDSQKISLGMKQTQPDPWEAVEAKYPLGTSVTGHVTKLENFGAFVELEPGVEALIPISELSWSQRPRHASEVLQAGETVQPMVLQVDPGRRRISLSLKQAQANPWAGAAEAYPPQTEHAGRVTRIVDFGAFVEFTPGVEGLVHISELSDQHVRRVEDVVQVDQTIKVLVLEVDEANRRISLSLKQTADAGQAASAFADSGKPAKKRKRPLRGGLD
ncbi:hypothetical protein LCGC14_1669430 [marine sediment metagenome]|uniref:adenine phosphoribosyltransferase n=1 Tax=marine sediment metagenome TaxID=412755 RepID=A0A0F9K7P1_9ZZZZ